MGVADDGTIKGIETDNRFRSKVQDILNKLEPKLDTTVAVKKILLLFMFLKVRKNPMDVQEDFF